MNVVVLDEYLRRLRLDAGALGLRAVLEVLDEECSLEDLDQLDDVVQREAARRSVWLPSVAQLAALEDETAAWVRYVPDLEDDLEELLDLAPVAVNDAGAVTTRPGDVLEGPDYRYQLEQLRFEARDAIEDALAAEQPEAGYVGPFAQPSDVQRQLDAVDQEVEEVDQVVRRATRDVTLTPAQRDAVYEWQAWTEAWRSWFESDPSTWWGATLNELATWRAELAHHRQRLEVVLAAPLSGVQVAQREVDPLTRTVQETARTVVETATGAASSFLVPLAVVVGVGIVGYAAAAGKLGRSRR